MPRLEDILKIERGLWTNDRTLYQSAFLPEALLVFHKSAG
jgi:hypothetical protein